MKMHEFSANDLARLRTTFFHTFNEGSNKAEYDHLRSLLDRFNIGHTPVPNKDFNHMTCLNYMITYRLPKHERVAVYEAMSRFV